MPFLHRCDQERIEATMKVSRVYGYVWLIYSAAHMGMPVNEICDVAKYYMPALTHEQRHHAIVESHPFIVDWINRIQYESHRSGMRGVPLNVGDQMMAELVHKLTPMLDGETDATGEGLS